jgi:ribosomal protein S18 acetylase RimI-like enzyme
MISIRPYAANDQLALQQLMAELQNHLSDMDPLKRIRNIEDFDAAQYIDHLLDKVGNDKGKIFVAEEQDKLIGFIAGAIPNEDPDDALDHYPAKEGSIIELVISQEYHGQGTGRALMEKMEEYFREKNCEYIRVGCFAQNTNTHAFYEKRGYADRHVEMLKQL